MSNGTTRIAAARVKNNENILIEAFRLARRSMLCQALCTSIAWYSSISSDRALIFSICRNVLFSSPLSRIYDCLFLYRHSQNKNTTAKRLFLYFSSSCTPQ